MNGYIRSLTENLIKGETMPIKKISGLGRMVWLVLFMLAFMLVLQSFAWVAFFKHTYIITQPNTGVVDTFSGTWEVSGCSVEVMYVNGNNQYDPPGGDDVIVGAGKISALGGRFTVTGEVTTGWPVYIRVWNANNTKYGTSEITTVPIQQVVPQYGYDVGPGGLWTSGTTTSGANVPALYVNQTISTLLPTIVTVKPATVELGDIITIEGSNFGSGSGGLVTIEGITITKESCLSWSSNTIEVRVTADMTANSGVAVSVFADGQTSNTKTLDIDPYITTVVPSTELVSGVTSLTITGGGFGSGTVTVNYNGASGIGTGSVGGDTVTTTVPKGGTSGPVSGNLTVSLNSRTSDAYAYTMATPEIASIDPLEGNIGDTATIYGTKFGTVDAGSRSTSVNHVNLGDNKLTDGEIVSWETSFIKINVTSIATAGVYAVTVEAGGNSSSDAVTYTVTPEITRVSSSDGSFYIGHTNVTIEGTAFGGAKGLSTALVGGITIEAPVTWSPTKITGIISSLEAAGTQEVMVSVESGGVYYPANIVQIICKPYITTLTPSFGTAEVTWVIINGYGFGTTGEVKFNGTAVTSYHNWANTSIEALVPFGATTGPVTVEVNGQKSNGKLFIVNDVPVIASLDPNSGSTKTRVTIGGSGFNGYLTGSTVTFNGVSASIESWTSTAITVEAPAGGTTGPVVVNLNSTPPKISNNNKIFTYVTPEVVSITPPQGNISDEALITGTKFGTVEAGKRSSLVNNVTLGGNKLTDGEIVSWETTFIKIKVTSIATAGVYAVTIEAADNITSDAITYTVTPEITKVSSSDGFFYIGHTNVTIEGTAFGGAKGLSSAIIGGLSIEAPVTWSPTKITGILSSLEAAGTQEVMVTVESGGVYYPTNIIKVVCKPYITTLTPSFGTPEATWVIINGYGFGTTGEVTFNGTSVTSYHNWANTSIEAKVPFGATTGPVTVEVNGQKSNGKPFTVSIVPVIATITPESGSTKTTVVITGINFGPSGTVSFESGVTAGNIQWSSTVITVEAPAGGKTGNVYVRQGANVSNGVLFTYLTPEVVTIDPPEGNVGDTATINGSKFGTVDAVGNNRSSSVNNITLSGIQLATSEVISWETTFIKIKVLTSIATAGVYAVTIEAADNITSDAITYTVTPEITKVSSSDGYFYIGHTNVTIEGTAFGGAKGLSTAMVGGITIEAPVTWSPTKITGMLSSLETAGTQEVMVSIESGGVYYPTNIVQIVCKPYITTLTPSFGTAEVTSVIINGYGFGTTGEVTFNGIKVKTYSNWANTSIEAKVPGGALTGPVTVEVNGQKSNGKLFTVNMVPVIASLDPDSGSTKTTVTVGGTGFGSYLTGSTVKFNGVVATIDGWSDTAITVEAPVGGTTGPVVVTLNSIPVKTSNNNYIFTYVTPEVVGIDPPQGNISDEAIITGTKFGTVDAGSRSTNVNHVNLGNNKLTDGEIVSWETTFIKIKVTSIATAGVYAVTIEAGGNSSSDAVTYTVTPEITKVSSSDGSFYIGHTNVTIEGTAFGGAKGLSSAIIGGLSIEAPVTWSPTKITGILSSLEAAGTQEVMVSVESGGVYYPANIVQIICKPYITTLTPSFGTAEVTSVIINGYGFGTTGEVTFNGIKVKQYSNWANTSIEAKVPFGATTGPVTVEVNGQKSNGMLFTVNIVPVIDTITPESGSTKTQVVITGINFGPSGTVSFESGVTAGNIQWSPTVITVEAPAGGKTGKVYVYNNSGNGSNGGLFTYLTPEVVTIDPSTGNVGDTATINGSKFGTVDAVGNNRSSSVNNITLSGIQLATSEVISWESTFIKIKVLTSIATAGVYAVTVEAGGNSSSDAVTYTVTPEITKVSSSDGFFYIGHTNVTIEGTAFGGAKGLSSAIIGGLSIEAPVTWSPTKITGILSSLETAGTQEVMVTVESGGVYYPANIVQIVCKPYITTLTPGFGTPEATSVIINGYGFGTTGEVTFNGTAVTSYDSWANTSIEAKVPLGATTGPVTVEVNGQKSNGKPFMVSIVPVITSITPESGSTKTKVTIVGRDFGTGTGTVSFESVTAGNIQWSPTVITVEAPAGGKTGNVYVRQGADVSNGVLFTYVTPEVVSIDPPQGNISDEAMITGTKFGTVDAGSRSTGINNVQLGGIKLTDGEIVSWETTFIKIKVLTSIATAGVYAVTIEAADNITSDAVTYKITPEITSVTGSDSPTTFYIGHTNVTIEGTAFGGAKGLSSAIVGGLTIEAPVTWSPTKITGILPSTLTAGTQEVMVTVESGGVDYPANSVQIVCKPYITLLTTSEGPVGTLVTLEGFGFGTTGEVTFSGTKATWLNWISSSTVEVKVPSGGSTGLVTVEARVNGQKSDGKQFNVLTFPYIGSITPESGSTKTIVTIIGDNFQTKGIGDYVSFEGAVVVDPAGYLGWTNNLITVEAPAGGITGKVYVFKTTFSNPGYFTYVTPEVTGIIPSSGYVSDEAMITGTKFGTVDAGSRSTWVNNVKLGGIQLADGDIVSWETSFIKIKVPTSIATAGVYAVTVEAGGNSSSDAVIYTVSPEITSTPATYYIGNNMTISGWSFGPTRGTSYVKLVNDGNTYILTPQASKWSATSITLSTPEGLPITLEAGASNTTIEVVVVNGGTFISNVSAAITCEPNAIKVTPYQGYPSQLVTIEGFGFDTTGIVTFGAKTAATSKWTNTSIEVFVPSLTANPITPYLITVEVNGQLSQPLQFWVTTTPVPLITSVIPGTVHLGDIITIEGVNFSDSPSDGDHVTVNGTEFYWDNLAIKYWSDTIIRLTVTASMTAGSSVEVRVTSWGYPSTPYNKLNIDPWITTLVPSTELVSGITNLIITGGGFGSGTVPIAYTGASGSGPASNGGSTITTTVPKGGASGPVSGNLTVTVNSRTSETYAYTMATPEITGITPPEGNISDEATITGTKFGTVDAGSRSTAFNNVNLGGIQLTDAEIVSWETTLIKINVTSIATAGMYAVTVEAGGNISSDAITYTVTPEITLVTGSDGSFYIGHTNVTIEGTAFGAGIGLSTAMVGGVNITPLTWDSSKVTGMLPDTLTAGTQEVMVTVESGGISYPANIVQIVCRPYITLLTTTEGIAGDVVTLEGFGFGTTGEVTFNGTPATANWISSMTVEAVVPSGATNGPVTIKVNGQESNGRLFTITAADIIFCAPALYRGDTDTYVTVEGLHTNFTGTVVANINPASGITVGTVDATDANHATVFITTIETNAAVGTRDITLTWAGGIATGEGLFVIKAPTLESIVPNSGVTGEVMIATIEGKGTHFNPGTILTFSATGVTGEVLSVIGPTTATVRIYTSSDASGGTRNVIMTTDLGGPVGTEEVTGPGMFTVIGPSHDTEGPSIEAVSVNGRRFIPRYNDILVPTFTLTANVIDMPIVGGVGVDTIEVIIDEYSSVALHLSPEYLNYIMTVQVTIPEELRNITSHLITIKAKDKAGNETTYRGMGVLIKGEVQIIGSVYNFPNPFKPLSADPQSNTTVIQYTLSTDSPVIVVIYDISGHEVQRVVSPAGANGGRAGLNSVSWHGRNLFGEVVGNGMYICKIISRGRVIGTGKLVIMD